MKTLSFSFALCLLINLAFAQKARQKLAVVGIDKVNEIANVSAENLGSMVMLEIEKTQLYEVLDKYDIRASLKQLNINADDCHGKSCMLQVGKNLNAEKMLGGLVETYPKKIVVNLRLLDVQSGIMEKQTIREYNVIPQEVGSMIGLTVQSLVGVPVDSLLYKRLTQNQGFENAVTMPNVNRLKADGPRMGYSFFSGQTAQILARPEAKGGFNAAPALFQFGYQFETEYLNAGKYQALFEFIPMVSGLDQGLFLPSFTIINGLRNNINGWEVGIGPIFRITKMAQGQVVNGELMIDQTVEGGVTEKRLDSRGSHELTTSVVIAAGKTIRSGKLNLPINVFAVPGKNSFQFGFSFGFNSNR